MNKKLAVLLVVPILIAMGGTFAFSAFSGSSSVAINSTAGHLTWDESGILVATNANNTPLTVEGPNGVIYEIGASEPYAPGSSHLNLGTLAMSTANSGKEYVVNATNFAPGEYIEVQVTITNNGTVGFIVSPGAMSMTTSSDATYNSANAPINATQVSEGHGNFMSELQSSTGYIYNVTTVSGFNTSLSPEGTAIMDIWVGLGNSNGKDVNHYQGSDFSLNINLNVVSDP